ncbi:MAG TPA: PH domain-containing protein [Mycobacteriales bacterium]|nr:PH domain-containing protein [Mycobacteriales bacterium]
MTDAPARAAGLPTEWARLHPLSPVVRSARVLVALAAVLAPRQLAPGQHQPPWIDLGVLGLAIVAGVVSWLVTRWRIHNGELQVETGLLRRESVRVPLTRLQAVDVVRPLAGRMLGLAEVRVVVAGQGSRQARLAYVTEEQAGVVRAKLLALAHGLAADTPEPGEAPILAVPGWRIAASNAIGAPAAVVVAVFAIVVVVAVLAPAAVAVSTVSTGFVVAFGAGSAAVRRAFAEWEFRLGTAPDGLRLSAGLLQTRAETIPIGRVQAVRWVQPLLWRALGWVRLEVDVARRHGRDRASRESAATTRALLPVGTAAEAAWLLALVLPGASLAVPPDVHATAPLRARLRAPFSRHYLRAWHDNRYIVCGSGRIRAEFVVVPLHKAQSIRWSQGPLQRRLKLADVFVDSAGAHFPGRARMRDAVQAQQWAARLPDAARAARAAHG